MMWKRLAVVGAAALMAMSIVGCGGEGSKDNAAAERNKIVIGLDDKKASS